MRTALIIVLLALSAADTAAAGSPPPRTRTRSLTPGATALLVEAARRSSIVRTLLEELDQTDVVVYVSDSMSGADGEPRAYLGFVGHAAGIRYVLVRIEPRCMPASESIAVLAHELQHAVEVALAPDVRDAASLARLYRHIGWESGRGRFETDRARSTGDRVRRQLAERPLRESPRP